MIVAFFTDRETYSAEDSAKHSITVRELIDELEQYDEDAKVVFANDNGFTYGKITNRCIAQIEDEETEEDE